MNGYERLAAIAETFENGDYVMLEYSDGVMTTGRVCKDETGYTEIAVPLKYLQLEARTLATFEGFYREGVVSVRRLSPREVFIAKLKGKL